jgi:hypothetical protein
MFAVVVTVELPEGGTIEQGRQMLNEQVIPMVKQRPGFRTAYWLAPPAGRDGLSFIVFDSEENARSFADTLQVPPPVKLVSTEVREVAASA